MENKSDSRLRRIWYSMIYRCHGKGNHIHYKKRGITVCDEWRNSFEVFKKWALENGYKDNLTIDRKDSDRNYCPTNCQWISKSENSKKAAEVLRKRKREGHPKNGEWMVVEEFVVFRYFGYVVNSYRVLRTGLYKCEGLALERELKKTNPYAYYYTRLTKNHKVGDIIPAQNAWDIH